MASSLPVSNSLRNSAVVTPIVQVVMLALRRKRTAVLFLVRLTMTNQDHRTSRQC